MYAYSLQLFLTEYFSQAEIGSEASDSFGLRFKSLRGCNLLPQGRSRSEEELSDKQVALAVLGSSSIQPSWAGFQALALSKLRVVGGSGACYLKVDNLLDAVVVLINSQVARKQLVGLALSTAESSGNTNGRARLIFKGELGELRQASFVSPMAVSLFEAGKELDFDHYNQDAKVSRETNFSSGFFELLAVEASRCSVVKALRNSSEYDDEETEAERFKRLGVRNGSRYLNIGVDSHVVWPAVETLINSEGYEMVLMPRTKDNAASIHVDISLQELSEPDAGTLINRFLSLLTWRDDHYAMAQGGWSGNPVPIAVPKRELMFVTSRYWSLDEGVPTSELARRALALYREARNAQENYLVSYAVLNYYKILELVYPEGPDTRAWIAKRLFDVQKKCDQEVVSRFRALCGTIEPQKYIYDACRLAVAHASKKSPSDPDVKTEVARLHIAAQMLRFLSRDLISNELKVRDTRHS